MLPYLETTEADYPHKAASTFTINNYGAGMELLRGPCPRCLALIEIPIFKEIAKGGADLGRSPDEPVGEPMICTCDEEHEGRVPAGNYIRAGKAACWYWWRMPPRRSCLRM